MAKHTLQKKPPLREKRKPAKSKLWDMLNLGPGKAAEIDGVVYVRASGNKTSYWARVSSADKVFFAYVALSRLPRGAKERKIIKDRLTVLLALKMMGISPAKGEAVTLPALYRIGE